MITLYGIPNCDTIKKARNWLEKNSIEYQFHDFKQASPTNKQLDNWIMQLGWEKLLNKRSTSWRNLSDKDKINIDHDRAIKIMLTQPVIIKRPVLEMNGNFHVGFTEKTYQDIFK